MFLLLLLLSIGGSIAEKELTREPYYEGSQLLSCVSSLTSEPTRVKRSFFGGLLSTIGGIFLMMTPLAPLGIPLVVGGGATMYTKYYHELIKYRGHIFEWGSDGFSNGNYPRNSCPIEWKSEPRGYSQVSIYQMKRFGYMYKRKNGEYTALMNNCHTFGKAARKFLGKTFWRGDDDSPIYYGSQKSICASGRSKDRGYNRLLEYNGTVLRWDDNGFHVERYLYPRCPITWESQPRTKSICPKSSVFNFGIIYERESFSKSSIDFRIKLVK